MNFKERVLTALNHEEPDRVPVLGLINQALSNQILGKQPADVGSMLGNAELRSGIKDIMNSNTETTTHTVTSSGIPISSAGQRKRP